MERSTGNIVDAKTVERMKDLCVPMEIEPTKAQMLRKPPRIGRNEPCGCGSGKKFKNCCYLKERQNPNGLSPAETAFGMMVWLTQRQTPITLGGASNDATVAAMAAGIFCEVNGLGKPATMENLKFPVDNIPLPDEKLGPSGVDAPLTGYITRLEAAAKAVEDIVDEAALHQWQVSPDVLRALKELAKAALENRDPVEAEPADAG